MHDIHKLKFIHITKTGGSSIENVGKKHNLYWGRFHKEYAHRWHKPFVFIDQKIKDKYDWFTVVRNPYTRIVSEFYCKWVNPQNKNVTDAQFNRFIIKYINARNTDKTLDFHYREQCLYIDTTISKKLHILKFEDLKNEFDNLMIQYNVPHIILDEHINTGYLGNRFTIKNLSKDTISLIQEVYQKDFELFNYNPNIEEY